MMYFTMEINGHCKLRAYFHRFKVLDSLICMFNAGVKNANVLVLIIVIIIRIIIIRRIRIIIIENDN